MGIDKNILSFAREVLLAESNALVAASVELNEAFLTAVEYLLTARKVIVAGQKTGIRIRPFFQGSFLLGIGLSQA